MTDDGQPHAERSKQSEWNRTLDKIFRMNEIEADIMSTLFRMAEEDGHQMAGQCLHGIEILFLLGEGVWKKEEKETFQQKRDDLRGMLQKINKKSRGWYSGGAHLREGKFKMSPAEMDKFTDILRFVFECQQKHGLGIKTMTKTTFKEQEDNVMGVG